ncbi:DUF349 domain-containing protein [Amnibacterium sp.]|uniref:DUF349 domain-containing protein n=1 Tax=Amnibacterium sp. TaxID=1872496 RepID=UPI0039C8877D
MTTSDPETTTDDATTQPAEATDAPWGRVDEHGVVFVRDRDGERQVGEYPDATPEEALAYYQRKFTDLAAQVTLLEQRAHRGAPPADVAKAVKRLSEALEDANAVGDLEALRRRVAALGGTVEDLSAKRSEEHKAEVEAARADRVAIVEEAEALAARDPATVQWKATTQAMDALFARWQEAQRSSARLPKSESNDLWKRFRDARSTIDTQRRAYFAELDQTQGAAREAKERLVQRAEALAGSSGDAIGEYRSLLDQWKAAGRAGRKVDDALWARFRAAGDAIYQTKAAVQAEQDAELGENLTVKLALLEEAEPLLKATDATAARKTLTGIQRRWDAAGRVPRDQLRPVEDRLRRIEQHVAQLEQEHWRRTNPETKARSEGLAAQLSSAIEKLERELEEAQAAGDARRIKDAEDALNARRIWLDAIG